MKSLTDIALPEGIDVQVIEKKSTIIHGIPQFGVEVRYPEHLNLSDYFNLIRTLAHNHGYVTGIFHKGEFSQFAYAMDIVGVIEDASEENENHKNPSTRFGEFASSMDEIMWLNNCFPHNEMNQDDDKMYSIIPDEFCKNDVYQELSDHIIFIRTEETQKYFRTNSTAIVDFSCVAWAINASLPSLIENLKKNIDHQKHRKLINALCNAKSILDDNKPNICPITLNNISYVLLFNWEIENPDEQSALRREAVKFAKKVRNKVDKYSRLLPLNQPGQWYAISSRVAHYNNRIVEALGPGYMLSNVFYRKLMQHEKSPVPACFSSDWLRVHEQWNLQVNNM